jgi:hypothetical protein
VIKHNYYYFFRAVALPLLKISMICSKYDQNSVADAMIGLAVRRKISRLIPDIFALSLVKMFVGFMEWPFFKEWPIYITF